MLADLKVQLAASVAKPVTAPAVPTGLSSVAATELAKTVAAVAEKIVNEDSGEWLSLVLLCGFFWQRWFAYALLGGCLHAVYGYSDAWIPCRPSRASRPLLCCVPC